LPSSTGRPGGRPNEQVRGHRRLRAKVGALAASRKHIDENAQMSSKREPGCRRFAVLV
jgi:quinol monooxygenase YgiN